MDARVFERACSRSRLRRRLSWTWLGIDRGDAFDARVRRLRPSTSANGRGPRRRYVDAPKQRPGMGAIDKRRSSDQAWVRSTSAEAATRPGCGRQAPKQRPGMGAVDVSRTVVVGHRRGRRRGGGFSERALATGRAPAGNWLPNIGDLSGSHGTGRDSGLTKPRMDCRPRNRTRVGWSALPRGSLNGGRVCAPL